jgi:hypothetical protein
MTTRDDIESFIIRMETDYEEVDEGMWLLKPPEEGAPVVVNYSPPVVLLRLKVMDIPPDLEDSRAAVLYRRLLELNATDILHGSYGIEENEIVLSDALELENLDFSELRGSYESMTLAATGHVQSLSGLMPVAQEG